MKAKICNYGGCNNLCDDSGYCAKHKDKKPKPFQNARRYTERYQSSEWITFRRNILSEQPTCEVCGSLNNVQVHHIIPVRFAPSLFLERSNVQVLCRECHQKETAKEIRNRRK